MKTIVIVDSDYKKVLILPYKEKVGEPADFLEKLQESNEISTNVTWTMFEEKPFILNLS